jgi:hypothetical protein
MSWPMDKGIKRRNPSFVKTDFSMETAEENNWMGFGLESFPDADTITLTFGPCG